MKPERFVIKVVLEPDGKTGYVSNRSPFEPAFDLEPQLTPDLQDAEPFSQIEVAAAIALLTDRSEVASATWERLA